MVAACWRDAQAAEARWTVAMAAMGRGGNPAAYGRSWGRLDRAAGF